jgi:hypothetical protein
MFVILLFNVVLFFIFISIGYKSKNLWWLNGLYFLLFILAMANVFYYAHLIDNNIFYYEYRTQYWADLTPSLSGFLLGCALKIPNFIFRFSIESLLFFLAFLGIFGPWAKPILFPMNYDSLQNRWRGEICMQSTGTCGPCSLANILNANDIESSENELAREAYTTSSGTESWYLARCAKRRGFKTRFINDANHLEKNSIIGIALGKTGHFISILDIKDDVLFIADSITGIEKVKRSEFHKLYTFKGMSLVLSK